MYLKSLPTRFLQYYNIISRCFMNQLFVSKGHDCFESNNFMLMSLFLIAYCYATFSTLYKLMLKSSYF